MQKIHTCWGRGFRRWSRRQGRFWPLNKDLASRTPETLEGRWNLSSAPWLLRPPHLSAWPLPFPSRSGGWRREASERWCCAGAVSGGWTTERPPQPRAQASGTAPPHSVTICVHPGTPLSPFCSCCGPREPPHPHRLSAAAPQSPLTTSVGNLLRVVSRPTPLHLASDPYPDGSDLGVEHKH